LTADFWQKDAMLIRYCRSCAWNNESRCFDNDSGNAVVILNSFV